MTNYLDDDENVKAMRETAKQIGLTQLLIDGAGDLAFCVDAPDGIVDTTEMLSHALLTFVEALRLLGVTFPRCES